MKKESIFEFQKGSLKTERQSNIELLRIISMLVIVIHHFAAHGMTDYSTYNPNLIGVEKVLSFYQTFGKVGVNVFVLIGAYFLVGKSFSSKRIISLLVLSLFYSTTIYWIMKIANIKLPVEIKNENLFLPIPGISSYWFVVSYMVMLLFMPLLNNFLRNTSKKQLRMFLLALTIIWVIIPQLNFFFPVKIRFDVSQLGYSVGISFIYLYLIAGYIRLYVVIKKKDWLNWLCITILLFVCMYLSVKIPIDMSRGNADMYYFSKSMFQENSILTILLAVAMLRLFLSIDLGSSKIINYVSASTFAVYLIHDNSLLRDYLWKIVDNSKITSAKVMILYSLKVTAAIFLFCILIDIVRRILLGKLFTLFASKTGKILDKLII